MRTRSKPHSPPKRTLSSKGAKLVENFKQIREPSGSQPNHSAGQPLRPPWRPRCGAAFGHVGHRRRERCPGHVKRGRGGAASLARGQQSHRALLASARVLLRPSAHVSCAAEGVRRTAVRARSYPCAFRVSLAPSAGRRGADATQLDAPSALDDQLTALGTAQSRPARCPMLLSCLVRALWLRIEGLGRVARPFRHRFDGRRQRRPAAAAASPTPGFL